MGVSVLFGGPHCSYLNIYISRKIRLCVVDLEGQFQTTLPAKPINFLSENSDLLFSYSSIFCRSCQIHCFLHTVDAISKRLNHLSHIFASNYNLNMSSHWNSRNSVQKAVDLTTLAKNRRKMSMIDLNFQIKKFMILD